MTRGSQFHLSFHLIDGLKILEYARKRGIDTRAAMRLFEKFGADETITYLRDEGHRWQTMPVNVPRFPVADRYKPGPLEAQMRELRGSADATQVWEQLAKAHYGDLDDVGECEADSSAE